MREWRKVSDSLSVHAGTTCTAGWLPAAISLMNREIEWILFMMQALSPLSIFSSTPPPPLLYRLQTFVQESNVRLVTPSTVYSSPLAAVDNGEMNEVSADVMNELTGVC